MNFDNKVGEELESIQQSLGVISTVNEFNKPESATMYYFYDNAFNIFFVTRSESRKYKNIQKNPNVSFVVSSEHPAKTIQIEGVASEVFDPDQQVKYFDKLMAKAKESNPMPPVDQMVIGEMVFMKISIMWARCGNFEIMKEGDKFIETKLRYSNDINDIDGGASIWNFY
jgi:nitroimidazol reductase NimA-like FMN-containing flavoprotein (pyridoxamine 5'-phosphate oxidase superfamily)